MLYEVKYEPLKDDEPIRYSETKPQSPIDQSLNASQLHQAGACNVSFATPRMSTLHSYGVRSLSVAALLLRNKLRTFKY